MISLSVPIYPPFYLEGVVGKTRPGSSPGFGTIKSNRGLADLGPPLFESPHKKHVATIARVWVRKGNHQPTKLLPGKNPVLCIGIMFQKFLEQNSNSERGTYSGGRSGGES